VLQQRRFANAANCNEAPLSIRVRNGEFDDAYRRAGTLLDASPHCQRWRTICFSGSSTHRAASRIGWDSAERHLQGFRQGADFKASSRRPDRSTTTSRR
jgi:hypothetical protein